MHRLLKGGLRTCYRVMESGKSLNKTKQSTHRKSVARWVRRWGRVVRPDPAQCPPETSWLIASPSEQ